MSEPSEQIGDRLHSGAIRLLRWLREADRSSDLPAAPLSALSVVVHGGPLSLKELAAAEQVTSPTMSRIVGRLADDGLVSRDRDPRDRRQIRIEATAAGRAVLEEGRERRLALLRGALAELPQDRLRSLARGVDALELLLEHRPEHDR